MKKALIILALVGMLIVSMAPQAESQGQKTSKGKDVNAKAISAAERGLAFLATKQNANGSWTCKIGYKLGEDYMGEIGDDVGVTALGCMAFMAGGHTPSRGKYSKNVEKGLDFVLSCVRPEDGYITKNGTRMYSHAFATMFLAEIYGMTQREDIKGKLKQAVQLIVNSQNKEGGWRYQPIPADADLSVTVSTLQALRASRNCGISVPKNVIDKAVAYVKKAATPSGFAYQPSDVSYDTRYTFPLTACGLVSLYSAGEYDSKEIKWGLASLERRRGETYWGSYHYFYGHYYGVQATYQAGGQYWQNYFPALRDEIVKNQEQDGGWSDTVGRNYATAMACIILQIPLDYLPIFQK